MAFDTGVFASNANLILNPDAYDSAGGSETDLGLIGSVHRIGFKHDIEVLTKQNFGSEHIDARILSTNIAYQVIVQNRSEELTEIIFHGMASSDAYGNPSYAWGNIVTSSETNKLLLRPESTTKPMLYFPRALILDVGPVTWHRRQDHHAETVLTFIGLRDHDNSLGPYYYGDYNQFPSLGGGEE